ncbi:MAG: hypothetical protein WCR21_08260 [Bacteroidota bacterium]
MRLKFKVFLLAASVGYFSCNKQNVAKNDQSLITSTEHQKSVEKVGNNYRINLNIIEQNLNKKELTKNLQSRHFTEIITVNNIPFFIQAFLKEVHFVDDFEMAAKDEEWQNGALPNLVPTVTGKKYYNEVLHDSVNEVQLVQKNLPSKKLIYCGLDSTCFIIACYNGGRRNSSQIAIIQFSGNKIENYWFDYSSDVVTGKYDLIQKLKSNRVPKTKSPFSGC